MRIRINFHKTDAMRYTGHLDLHKTWERTFRRAGLPLAYSQGFHPQPKINLACALPLGFTSEAELLDAWLEQELPLQTILEELNQAAPPGISIESVSDVTEKEPTLQVQVRSAVYEITLLEPIPALEARVANLLAANSILRERRGKKYDLRPLVEDITILPDISKGSARLHVQLSARESATGRPEELLLALEIDPRDTRVHRVQLIRLLESKT